MSTKKFVVGFVLLIACNAWASEKKHTKIEDYQKKSFVKITRKILENFSCGCRFFAGSFFPESSESSTGGRGAAQRNAYTSGFPLKTDAGYLTPEQANTP